jgi:SAM-dependent methyltransferase
VSYSAITFSDRNPIKRFLQGARLSHAVKLTHKVKTPRAILDFGAGNGELCKLLRLSYPDTRILCYEPDPLFLQEAQHNLKDTRNIELLLRLDGVEIGNLDLILCLEVFEHLPQKETIDVLSQIANMLSDHGTLIVGVPIEIGIPAIYKGLFRMTRRYGEFDAMPKNVLSCALGRPPIQRPISELRDGRHFHYHHVGFDHRRFQSVLSQHFEVQRISAAPFAPLGTLLNPEIYFMAGMRRNTPR